MSDNLIETAVTELIKKEPFFANLILNMTRTYTTDVPTLGVNVTDNVNLYINPYFWKSMNLSEQVDVLKHECIFGDSLIETDKGKLPIKDIVNQKLSVKVLSISKNNELEYKEIIQYSKQSMKDFPNKKWIKLTYGNKLGISGELICTQDHRIAYVKDMKPLVIGYKKAEECENRFGIFYNNQEHYPITIYGIEFIDNASLDLYDIAVKDNHNFFANNINVHNCYHVMMNHFSRFNYIEPDLLTKDKTIVDKIKDMFNANRLNRAADYAINEYLPNLPKKLKMFDKEGNVILEPLEIEDDKGNKIPNPSPNAGKPMEGSPCLVSELKKEIPNVQTLQNTEYYYEILKQKDKKDEQEGKGQKVTVLIDDHSLWQKGNSDEEFVTEKVKSIVNKSVEQSGGIGRLPGDVLEAINKLNYKPKNWKQDLQRFVAKTAEIVIESSRKARNRRYGIVFPGTKVYPKLHLVAAIDESGSVDTEALYQFMAEIDRIHRDDVKITLIACDAEIQWIGEFDPKHKFEFKGRGGTAFKPVFDKCKELKIDGLIYFTDGQNFEGSELKKPNFPVLWALLPNCDVTYNWGAKTKIEIKKNLK